MNKLQWFYRLLGALAVLIVLGELGHYFLTLYTTGVGHVPNGFVISIAAVVGFIAFYKEQPKEAREVWTIVTTTGLSALEIVRSGRRKTDPAVAVPATPDEPPAQPTVVPDEAGRG